ncbi:MAG TPA: ABC transporter substrate-binding protein [Thermoanaerobaculia bacterium]|nr:ABC transporter substrate-binding protein [Thermoanaerobaculia bacterium]
MSRMVRFTFAAAAVASLGAALACNGGGPIQIGAVLPLTGDHALYGEPIRQGLELAYQELQADEELGFEIALTVEDSGSDPQRSAELARQLYQQGAVAVIGGVTTDAALAMVPAAEREDKILMSPSASSPRLTGISRNFFRLYPSDFKEGSRMGNFAAQTLGIESAVILASESDYASGVQDVFKTEFERYGGTVPAVIEYPADTTDFTAVVEQALGHNPVAVYVADYARNVATIVGQLRQHGFEGKILTTSAFASPEVIEQAGQAAEGVILTLTSMPPDDPQVAAFSQTFEAEYGHPPSVWAAHGYDALMVLVAAIEEVDGSPRDLWQGLRGLRNYHGATGVVQFDERGDVGKYPRTYVIDEGALSDYEETLEEKRQELLRQIEQINRAARAAGGSGS